MTTRRRSRARATAPGDDKAFGEALWLAIEEVDAETGQKKLRQIAQKLVDRALEGEGWAIKEIAGCLERKAVAETDATPKDQAKEKVFAKLTADELSQRIAHALRRVDELAARVGGESAGKKGAADLCKRDPNTG